MNERPPMKNADSSQYQSSRRSFLIASGAIATALGAGIYLRFGSSREQWVESVIRDNLPGIRIDEDSFPTFIKHAVNSDALKPATHRLAVLAEQALPWVTARIPKVHNGLEKLERRILTEFLLGSNFFRVPDPKRETIVYYGPAIACSNPFVSFA